MWENETVVLVTSLKKRILGGREKVRFERIDADNAIPGFIKRLFRDRVSLYLVKESPLALQATPHFDLDISELNTIKDHSNAVLYNAATFFEKEIESLLQEALVLRLDYLIKPVSTMKKKIFTDGDHHALVQIEDRLEPFKKTMPYGDMLIQSCQANGLTSLDLSGYQSLVDAILRKLAGIDPVSWLMRDFTILTDFLSESKGEEVSRLDGMLLKDFMMDRQQAGFAKAVGVEVKLGRNEFNSADLTVTLKRYQELRSEFSNTVEQQPVQPVEVVGTEASIEPLSLDVPTPAAESPALVHKEKSLPVEPVEEEVIELADDWDLDETTTPVPEPLSKETVEEISTTETAPPVATEEKTPKGMRIIRREQSEEEAAAPVPEAQKSKRPELDLRSLIDTRTEKSFVKKLFGGDRDAYDSLLDKLNDAESWRVAKILIDNELFKRDVDPFSREAIKLVDLVYGRYYPEENAGGQ